jgi:CRISPR system Cascade subunit CasA
MVKMHNFLTENLIEVKKDEVSSKRSLPALMSDWSNGINISLDGVRPHQKSAIHIWLCQLAAAALMRTKERLVGTAEDWKNRLLDIAPLEAWDLINDSGPALMQTNNDFQPLAENSIVKQPYDITVLINSKNHSVKQGISSTHSSPWEWLCALIEIQTTSGYKGRWNYGIPRINSRLGTRVIVSVCPTTSDASRWLRDVSTIVEKQELIWTNWTWSDDVDNKKTVALWTINWDNRTGINPQNLHPLYVDICRFLRLSLENGKIICKRGGSKSERVSVSWTNGHKGVMGDPWVPLVNVGTESFRIDASGWTTETICNILNLSGEGKVIPSLLQKPTQNETGDVFLIMTALVYGVDGKSKTGGWHERELLLPSRVKKIIFGSGRERDTLGESCKHMISDQDHVREILEKAVRKFNKSASKSALKSLQKYCDNVFFEFLWSSIEDDNSRLHWVNKVVDFATESLLETLEAASTTSGGYWKARAASMGLFSGKTRIFINELSK